MRARKCSCSSSCASVLRRFKGSPSDWFLTQTLRESFQCKTIKHTSGREGSRIQKVMSCLKVPSLGWSSTASKFSTVSQASIDPSRWRSNSISNEVLSLLSIPAELNQKRTGRTGGCKSTGTCPHNSTGEALDKQGRVDVNFIQAVLCTPRTRTTYYVHLVRWVPAGLASVSLIPRNHPEQGVETDKIHARSL